MNKKDKKQNIKHEDTVTKDMNLGELVAKYPEAAEVILDYGLHCVGCFASSFDTIEAGAKVHGLNDEEIDEMVDRINEVINFKE
jgi:hybrid cluster-associated redox disulfide protein